MPVKPETRFYRRVNSNIPHEVHRQKISTMYGNGTADFWYSGFKADAWVEYKWVPKLPQSGVDPLKLLSALQALWINRRYREGRRVYVIIGSPEGCSILENGAWNDRVENRHFSYSISDVSAYLSRILHDASAFSGSSGGSDKPDVQNSGDKSSDRRNCIRVLQTPTKVEGPQ